MAAITSVAWGAVIACGPSLDGLNGAARGFLPIAFIAIIGLLIAGRFQALKVAVPAAIVVTLLLAAL